MLHEISMSLKSWCKFTCRISFYSFLFAFFLSSSQVGNHKSHLMRSDPIKKKASPYPILSSPWQDKGQQGQLSRTVEADEGFQGWTVHWRDSGEEAPVAGEPCTQAWPKLGHLQPGRDAGTCIAGPSQRPRGRVEVEADPGLGLTRDGFQGLLVCLVSDRLQVSQVCVVSAAILQGRQPRPVLVKSLEGQSANLDLNCRQRT